MKLSKSQKEVILLMRRYDPKIMNLDDGYWFTGGHGIKVNGNTVQSLRQKKIITPDYRLSDLGKNIEL